MNDQANANSLAEWCKSINRREQYRYSMLNWSSKIRRKKIKIKIDSLSHVLRKEMDRTKGRFVFNFIETLDQIY